VTPRLTADSHVLSTLPIDTFVVASPGYCDRSDFTTGPSTVGFIYLNRYPYIARSSRTRLPADILFASTEVNRITDLDGGTRISELSEWAVRIPAGGPDSSFVLRVRPRFRTSGYPPFRGTFRRGDGATFLTAGDRVGAAEPVCRTNGTVAPPAVARANVSQIVNFTAPRRRVRHRYLYYHHPAQKPAASPSRPPTRRGLLLSMSVRVLVTWVLILAVGSAVLGIVAGLALFPAKKRPRKGLEDNEALLPASHYSEEGRPPVGELTTHYLTGRLPDTYGIPLVGKTEGSFLSA
jgi:hypothetical protein